MQITINGIECGKPKVKLPEMLLDDDGYPTQEYLAYIKDYDGTMPIMKFIDDIIRDGWWMESWGFRLHRKYNGKRKLELHTGGWSGNEDIISAITSNIHLTHFQMKYVKWTCGGHYYFEIDLNT